MSNMPKQFENEDSALKTDDGETPPSSEDYFRCPYCFLQLPPAKETIESHLLLEYASRGISPLFIQSLPHKTRSEQSIGFQREGGDKSSEAVQPGTKLIQEGKNVLDLMKDLSRGDIYSRHETGIDHSLLLPNNIQPQAIQLQSLEVTKLPIYLSMMRNFQVQQPQYNNGQGLFSETKQKPPVGYQQVNAATVPISSSEKQKQQYFARQLQLMNNRLDYTPNLELFQHSTGATSAAIATSQNSIPAPKYDFNNSSTGQHSTKCEPAIFVPPAKQFGPSVGSLLGSNYGMGLEAVNWCAHCSMSFRLTSDLVQHMRNFHRNSSANSNKRLLEATREMPQRDKNNDVISTASTLANHSGKNFKCNACGEMFKERHHLTRHLSSHTTPINRLSNANRYSVGKKDNTQGRQNLANENSDENEDYIRTKFPKSE